jgi:hypothetical protein
LAGSDLYAVVDARGVAQAPSEAPATTPAAVASIAAICRSVRVVFGMSGWGEREAVGARRPARTFARAAPGGASRPGSPSLRPPARSAVCRTADAPRAGPARSVVQVQVAAELARLARPNPMS